MSARVLALIERAGPDSDRQCADLLDFCIGIRTTFGSVDLALLGDAVAIGMDPASDAGPDSATAERTELTRRLRTLLRTGATMTAEQAAVSRLPVEATLLDGIDVIDSGDLALRWRDYAMVWFL